ncbi:DNA polymerase v family and armadillo-type fold domain-containing protein [Lasiodiplodia theobromae]|uniref:DNA polymerase v family and armadillo-type fold domain-containing protein n=1 Tax=Lasiodiplodia theobromae TaxID=45133 RepID=UPI0015C2FC4D|nr:DNA polymerase v family and armadillo-type fold domain-containing protein [Lasiodiplodia theobromae]KAF4540391.1 DNA polymerase v family and armadillo-type fold domain-containing protein [Lasiodiplodia theobromae]
MDSFETQNAAEWQPVGHKKRKPPPSRYEPSPSNTPRNQPRCRTHTSVIPSTSQREDILIDLGEPDEQPLPKTRVSSSNPFASLASEESSFSANSTPIHGRIGVLSPLKSAAPIGADDQAKQEVPAKNVVSRTSTPTKQPRTANDFDDLDGLDPSFFFTPPSKPLLPSSKNSIVNGQQESGPISPLDQGVPSMKREEDEAWFEAQLDKSTPPSTAQPKGTDKSRQHFQQSGQLIYPLGTPVVASYRGRESRSPGSRGNTRSRGTPRGRGGRHAHSGRQGSPSNVSQRSTYNFSGSEDSVLNQNSTRGRGDGNRGFRGQGIYKQSKADPVGKNMPSVWRKFRNGNMVQLLVHGTKEAVDEASKLIKEWISEILKMQRSTSKWAKVWSFNHKAERRLRKRLLKDEERAKYRQAISEGETLTYSTEFVWPLPKEPEQILGMNYEALDPIRMNCECYITCEKVPRTIFRIQGNNENKMRKALERMQRLPAEWYAKMFEAEPFVILDIPYAFDPDDLPPVIKVPYRLPRPLLAPTSAKEDGVTFRFKGPHQFHQAPYLEPKDSPAGKLLEAVSETTRHARYFRNMLKLHLHLGTFAARKTQLPDIDKDTYSFLSFSEMMEEHEKMGAKASMEIGDLIVERHVLARCFEASHILAPQDVWTYKLSDVQPVYCATFEIANPAGQAGDLVLDVELSADDGVTSVVSKRWSQLAKGKMEPRRLLDGNIIDLQNGGLTWHLGLDEFIPVDEHAAHDLSGGHNFVIYRSREDRLIKVPIKGEWVVEVSHVGKTTIGTDGQQTQFEPRWTFSISNNHWNKLLSSNTRADIGQVASWGHGNPGNLLFPLNPDSSALTGVARQDDELSSEGSYREDNNVDTSSPEERDDAHEEQPSLQNFEQLLNLLRTLTDVVVGNPHLDHFQ